MNYVPGYFAFPPTVERVEARIPFSSAENIAHEPPPPAETRPKDEDSRTKLKEQQRRAAEEEKRRKRQEQQRQEAYLSELAWVRSGGILRDAQGRRDKARTAMMQEEIRLQDEEKRIMDRWAAYEASWKALAASSGPVAWKDIPWPSIVAPSSPDDLTPGAITEFVFATFKVRGVNGLRKDRIRSSLLRWHPDKLSVVVSRVSDEERDVVVEGINAVFICLKQLQDEEKQAS